MPHLHKKENYLCNLIWSREEHQPPFGRGLLFGSGGGGLCGGCCLFVVVAVLDGNSPLQCFTRGLVQSSQNSQHHLLRIHWMLYCDKCTTMVSHGTSRGGQVLPYEYAVAVASAGGILYKYWNRRFGTAPSIGSTCHHQNRRRRRRCSSSIRLLVVVVGRDNIYGRMIIPRSTRQSQSLIHFPRRGKGDLCRGGGRWFCLKFQIFDRRQGTRLLIFSSRHVHTIVAPSTDGHGPIGSWNTQRWSWYHGNSVIAAKCIENFHRRQNGPILTTTHDNVPILHHGSRTSDSPHLQSTRESGPSPPSFGSTSRCPYILY